jgi:predicted RNase H-like HicB family nuclease
VPEIVVGEAEEAMALWLETARSEGLAIPEPRYKPDTPEAA